MAAIVLLIQYILGLATVTLAATLVLVPSTPETDLHKKRPTLVTSNFDITNYELRPLLCS